MKNKIKIIIADDHPIFRNVLKQFIEKENDIEIIGEAGDGEKALELIIKKKPDIALLDVDMPKKAGFELLKELNKIDNPVKVIFLTMYKEENLFNEAMDNGIKGYVLKKSVADDYAISPLISNYLVKRMSIRDKLKKDKPSINDLTLMERKTLKQFQKINPRKKLEMSFL